MKSLTQGMLAIAAVLVVGGCQTPPNFGEPEETFGAAVRHNIAVQTVDPDPRPRLAPPTHNGAKSAASMVRYQTDKIKQPREIRTADVGEE